MKHILTYIIIVVSLLLLLPGGIGFAAQWRTFYWDAAHCREVMQHDGLWQLVEDFFTQFLATRWSAALMLAVPCAVVSVIVGSLLRPLTDRLVPPVHGWVSQSLPALLAVIVTVVASYFVFNSGSAENKRFKAQMCLVEKEDWAAIIAQNEGRRVSNLLEQNIHNLALAETGELQKRLKQQPCRDVNSLFVLKIESPYVAALLADIYWSMGEISMSQMYAFEANEKMNNLSPRLLKRLALTNIAFGHYAVAAKYLNWLDKSLFYRDWSKQCRALLSDEAVQADRQMMLKRGCIPAENGFPSAQSVVYDLQQILAQNPDHRTSAEYLGALEQLYSIK